MGEEGVAEGCLISRAISRGRARVAEANRWSYADRRRLFQITTIATRTARAFATLDRAVARFSGYEEAIGRLGARAIGWALARIPLPWYARGTLTCGASGLSTAGLAVAELAAALLVATAGLVATAVLAATAGLATSGHCAGALWGCSNVAGLALALAEDGDFVGAARNTAVRGPAIPAVTDAPVTIQYLARSTRVVPIV